MTKPLFTAFTDMRSMALIVFSALLSAPVQAEELDLDKFNAIDAGGGIELTVEVGPEQFVMVEGSDRDAVEFKVRGNTLRIKQDREGIFSDFISDIDVHVTIRVPSLRQLEINTGAMAEVSGLDVDRIEVEVNIGGELIIQGRCGTLEIETSTGGYANASGLACKVVEAEASTGSNLEINAEDEIDASASLGGTIDVHGDAARQRISESLGGTVRS